MGALEQAWKSERPAFAVNYEEDAVPCLGGMLGKRDGVARLHLTSPLMAPFTS